MQDMRGLVHCNLLCFGVRCAHINGWRNLSEAPSDDRAYHGDPTGLRLAPEMRSWPAELDGDSRLAINSLPNRDYTALLLRLIPHVGQEQPLATRDPGLQPQQRPVLVDFKCLGLFVERLLFCIPAVNKQEYAMRPTRAFPMRRWSPVRRVFRKVCRDSLCRSVELHGSFLVRLLSGHSRRGSLESPKVFDVFRQQCQR